VPHGKLVYEGQGLSLDILIALNHRKREVRATARIDTGCTPAALLAREVGEDWGEPVGEDEVNLADGRSAPVDVYLAYVRLPNQPRAKRPKEVMRFKQYCPGQESLLGLGWLRDFEVCLEAGTTLRLYGLATRN